MRKVGGNLFIRSSSLDVLSNMNISVVRYSQRKYEEGSPRLFTILLLLLLLLTVGISLGITIRHVVRFCLHHCESKPKRGSTSY